MSSNEKITAEVEIPDQVKIKKDDSMIVVTGKKGILRKDVHKIPVTITVENRKVIIEPYRSRRKDLAIKNTARSIITNMVKGVDRGFTYKLKIVFAHFPIAVKVKGKEIHIENFFGERSPRISRIAGDTTEVKVVGEDVIVQGPSLEDVSQTAANIESSTKVKGKDQRVFLDGLYIYSREEGMQ